MLRGLLAVIVISGLAGCSRGSADDSASITPEPATRGVTVVEGSAELAPTSPTPPRPPVAPGSRVAVAEAPTPPPGEAPATRSVPLAITGMT